MVYKHDGQGVAKGVECLCGCTPWGGVEYFQLNPHIVTRRQVTSSFLPTLECPHYRLFVRQDVLIFRMTEQQ
jgi:hypothetical protein